ncbi:MAG TPA: fused response regulator/phosphatase [Porphyromonadaceae bacterium]|nr:fused response regulator/phosphatase [Porphyromonadaceae bacterium]
MAVKILSVDDELDLEVLIRQYFRRKIRKGEYIFEFAHNGVEALKVLLQHPDIDIILSDINMPEMDGLTLLTKINEMQNPAKKCIMVSAYGDMQNIRSAMNGGAFDFTTKPIDMEDLERTIEKAASQIQYIKDAQKEHAELNSLQQDLDIARDIQCSILPKVFPAFPEIASIDLYASMNAAKSVGGDFYDFFKLGTNKVGFIVADVCDKGIPSALFMTISRTVMRTITPKAISPADCLFESNNMITSESKDRMFVTLFYGVLDCKTGELVYCNGGHNSPIWVKADGTTEMLPRTGNMALGIMEDIPYNNKVIQLSPDDHIFCYTDGVTEAENAQKDLYGEPKLMDLLKGSGELSSRQVIENVTNSLKEFVGDANQSDDITMLDIKFNGGD